MRCALSSIVSALLFAGCGGVEADFRGGDAVSGDASDSYVSPTGCAGGASRLVLFQDADGDGYGNANGTTTTRCPEDAMPPGFASVDGDCNDSNAAVHTGCGGTTNPPPSGNTPVDADGDGYWTIQDGPPDCNDQDKTVSPGLPEICGNGKDDDCNTSTSDTCTVNPPPPSGDKVKVTTSYQTNISRELEASIVNDTNFMGPYWHPPNVSFTTTGIKEIPVSVEGSGTISPCGVLVNVIEPGNWLCYGHDASAHLDQAATTLVQYGGQNYTKDQCTTYSPPGGTDKGCAMWCSFHNPAARCHGK